MKIKLIVFLILLSHFLAFSQSDCPDKIPSDSRFVIACFPFNKQLLSEGHKATLLAGNGISNYLSYADKCGMCQMVGYEVTYKSSKYNDIVTIHNKGGDFIPEVVNLIKKAKVNDEFFFDKIIVLCPCNDTRQLNSLRFKINN